MLVVTVVLVRGIRESATTNAILVAVKLGVVLFVIGVGAFYIIRRRTGRACRSTSACCPSKFWFPIWRYTYLLDVEKLPKEEAKPRVQQLAQANAGAVQDRGSANDGARHGERRRTSPRTRPTPACAPPPNCTAPMSRTELKDRQAAATLLAELPSKLPPRPPKNGACWACSG